MFEGHGTETPVDVLEYGPKYWQKNVEESIEFLKNVDTMRLRCLDYH